MDGYDASTYGERFAEVYDDWYGRITDTDACVSCLADLAGDGPVLELGIGTGRLAVPLAERGLAVTGVDSSPAMLAVLAAKPGAASITAILGDMADPPVDTDGFSLAFVAYNTLFNLVDPGAQQACLRNAARRLAPDGRLVIEAFVPDPEHPANDAVTSREITADKVVLSVSRSQPDTQEVLGQYVDITEAGIALRPWHIRWSTPKQIDEMAEVAGLVRTQRWASWDREPFSSDAPAHISVYRVA